MSMEEKPGRPPPPLSTASSPVPQRPPTPSVSRNDGTSSRASHGQRSVTSGKSVNPSSQSGHKSSDTGQDEKGESANNNANDTGQRSVSLLSLYVDPQLSNTPDKLIQMTNYFIASALFLSLVLIIAAVCLFVSKFNLINLIS